MGRANLMAMASLESNCRRGWRDALSSSNCRSMQEIWKKRKKSASLGWRPRSERSYTSRPWVSNASLLPRASLVLGCEQQGGQPHALHLSPFLVPEKTCGEKNESNVPVQKKNTNAQRKGMCRHDRAASLQGPATLDIRGALLVAIVNLDKQEKEQACSTSILFEYSYGNENNPPTKVVFAQDF